MASKCLSNLEYCALLIEFFADAGFAIFADLGRGCSKDGIDGDTLPVLKFDKKAWLPIEVPRLEGRAARAWILSNIGGRWCLLLPA